MLERPKTPSLADGLKAYVSPAVGEKAPSDELTPWETRPAGTLASAAYRRLREEIICGEFRPGQRLHARQLCARFAIGLSPMREALNRLSSEGLVKQIDQRGFRVASLDLDDLRDLTRARCWLGETALRASLVNGDRAWEEAVIVALHRLERAPRTLTGTDGRRDPEWEYAHRHFHHSLIAACGSRRWLAFWEELFDAADRYRFASRIASADRRRDVEEHAAIKDAVIARDIERAIALLNAHMTKTEELVRDRLASVSR
jgi:DNA-binding GntR family transcriptional regulator